MKKPSERRADASAWLPFKRSHCLIGFHLARRGRLAWASTQLLMQDICYLYSVFGCKRSFDPVLPMKV